MQLDLSFFLISLCSGIGLAMDAFSVSLANGLNEPKMKNRKLFGIAGVFAIFQALMPLIGWVCVHTVLEYFKAFEKFIPWIALALLGYIGFNMLVEGIRHSDSDEESAKLGFKAVIIQGIATSIDALSVGLTISDYDLKAALISAAIIAAVTFVICSAGVAIGKKFGTKLSGKAQIFGGVILIAIGIGIFIKGII